ncbi:2-amino-4-hydroxy-6-hydroxymethyldihydropteridine diphosphokinase [Ruegeria arenilitoris]|uniref:2-amino-4-hydroxy-6- hydroxymethyldihydropteridine diphosphokinase n=1 Tax=Ruegeria arenilitoris TaxID=1173585 RepID=UPI00147CDDF0|nr:2-amino-4-hydroxy-6-hydroxymethyldihydropteridine diphosphokinase [Ruegeria arenilitoris]
MQKTCSKAVIALGANLKLRGNGPRETLEQSIIAMRDSGLVIRSQSRFFSTPCFPAGAGPDYVNAAISVETDLTPDMVLGVLHDIEREFGRERSQRWGMRTLDLDLVSWDALVLPNQSEYDHWRNLPASAQIQQVPERLILPHPRLQDRAFVLVPMADVDPEWHHPVLDKTVLDMIADLPDEDVAAIVPL